MNVETIITWQYGKPVSLRYGSVMIWEDKIDAYFDTLTTKVHLPFAESVQFISIIINGLNDYKLLQILKLIDERATELKRLEDEFQEVDLNINIDEDW